jgi:hypothetical protein
MQNTKFWIYPLSFLGILSLSLDFAEIYSKLMCFGIINKAKQRLKDLIYGSVLMQILW